MFTTRQWRRWFAWLALAATLAAAWMPAVSRIVASSRIENILMAELCAPSGMSYAALSYAGMRKPDEQRAGHLDDCSYCRLQADTPALPVTVTVAAPGKLVATHPPLYYHAPAPLFTWAAAQPRGPPLPA